MKTLKHPTIYICDFNNQRMTWDFDINDKNRNKLYEWPATMNLEHVFRIKGK